MPHLKEQPRSCTASPEEPLREFSFFEAPLGAYFFKKKVLTINGLNKNFKAHNSSKSIQNNTPIEYKDNKLTRFLFLKKVCSFSASKKRGCLYILRQPLSFIGGKVLLGNIGIR